VEKSVLSLGTLFLGSANPLSGILAIMEENNHLYNIHGLTAAGSFEETYTLIIKSRRREGIGSTGASGPGAGFPRCDRTRY